MRMGRQRLPRPSCSALSAVSLKCKEYEAIASPILTTRSIHISLVFISDITYQLVAVLLFNLLPGI